MNESLETLALCLGPDLQKIDSTTNPKSIVVFPASIVRVLMLLRDHTEMRFLQLIDLTAVDYPDQTMRYHIVYHILSHPKNVRLMVKIITDGSVAIPSAVNVFPNANWYEREVWDMFGIPFDNHPDLRRILTDYNFTGHPLRKDFPLSGYNEISYNEQLQKIEYKKLNLQQPYRTFDFLSPWEGDWKNLLKQEHEAHQE